jgi:hypothetical protein
VSTDNPAQAASEPGEAASEPTPADRENPAGARQEQPSEEELRAAYEAEISRITSTDMILQAVVSLLNIGGHRLGLAPAGPAGAQESPRDLEQVRDAIDGVRALLGILERREQPESLRPLRDALSQLQLAYAREAGASAPPAERPAPPAQPPQPAQPGAPAAQRPAPASQEAPGEDGPGPAQASGRLWVPGR